MSKVAENERKEGNELEEISSKVSGKMSKNNKNQDCSKHAKEFRCCPPDFCDMIGRREAKLTQLEKHKQDLDRRVEMQDLLLPVATMMALKPGDNLPDAIISVIDEQAAGHKFPCPCPNVSLSQHSDIRIRELESTRRKNIARREEAKLRLTEKKNAVDDCLNKINNAKKKQTNLEKKINEIEEKIGDGKLEGISESRQSVQSLGPDDLDYLMKLEELVKNELITKKQLNELEHRQEANMRALELAAQVMSQEKNNEELDGLKGMLQVKSSANQQLAHCICHLEDKLENLESKLIASNQQLAKYMDKKKIDVSIGDKIKQKNKESMILPETTEVETFSEILETKDQDVEAVASVESMGVLAQVDYIEKSVQDTSVGGGIESTGTMARPDVTDQSVQSQEALRVEDSSQFFDLPEENLTQNQFHTTDYNFQASTIEESRNESSGPIFIDLPELTNASSQLETTEYNLSSSAPEEFVNLPENISQSQIQTTNYNLTSASDELQNQLQTIDYNFESLAIEPTLEAPSRHQLTNFDFERSSEGDFVRLDRGELENWLEAVSNIRARISECQQCVESEPAVINLEKEMTRHLGREFVNLPAAEPGTKNKFSRIVGDTIIDKADTSEILTPPQTISFSVETSTPMPKINSTIIAPVEEQDQENIANLTEETEVPTPNESSIPVVREEINSSTDKETSGIQKGVNVIDENTQETSGKFGMRRNSSDIRNTIENAGNLVGPRRTLEIDESEVEEGEEEEEPGEIRHNEMLNDEENFVLSRGFEMNDKSLTMDSRQNNKNNQNSQSSLTVDKSAGSRILSPDKLSKKKECICLAAWPKMSKKQYEEFKKQSKKSSKKERKDDLKTISTSIAKPVETQTNYHGQPVPNFNCDPCYCDPCGPDCSSSSGDYENHGDRRKRPHKRNQAVSAKR